MGRSMKNGTRWDILELDTRKPLYVRYPKQNRPTSWLRSENSLQLKLLKSAWAVGRLFCGPMEKAFIDPTRIRAKYAGRCQRGGDRVGIRR
jgi:hypothetical protein